MINVLKNKNKTCKFRRNRKQLTTKISTFVVLVFFVCIYVIISFSMDSNEKEESINNDIIVISNEPYENTSSSEKITSVTLDAKDEQPNNYKEIDYEKIHQEQQELKKEINQKEEEEAEKERLKEQLLNQGTAGGIDYTSVMSLEEAKQDNQFQIVVAIVRQEGGKSYESAYAIISSAYNRCRCKNWQQYGFSIYQQLTAKGQYSWGISKYRDLCTKYLDMNNVETPCIQACYDIMYGGKQPMHNYCSFRSTSETKKKGMNIEGNTYFDPI